MACSMLTAAPYVSVRPGSTLIETTPKHRTEAKREHFSMNPAPATDDIMAVLVNGDDDAERNDKGNDSPEKSSECRN